LTLYHATRCSLSTLRGDHMANEFTVGQVARAVGVHIQTLRYYERLSLLKPIARRPSGYRLYGEEEVRRLRFIKNAQGLGFTLHEIAELLNLRVSSVARSSDVKRKVEAKLIQVEAKARELRALSRALRGLLQTCRDGQPTERCPILRSLKDEPNSQKRIRRTVKCGS